MPRWLRRLRKPCRPQRQPNLNPSRPSRPKPHSSCGRRHRRHARDQTLGARRSWHRKQAELMPRPKRSARTSSKGQEGQGRARRQRGQGANRLAEAKLEASARPCADNCCRLFAGATATLTPLARPAQNAAPSSGYTGRIKAHPAADHPAPRRDNPEMEVRRSNLMGASSQ